jgi:hypothetical protein
MEPDCYKWKFTALQINAREVMTAQANIQHQLRQTDAASAAHQN